MPQGYGGKRKQGGVANYGSITKLSQFKPYGRFLSKRTLSEGELPTGKKWVCVWQSGASAGGGAGEKNSAGQEKKSQGVSTA